MPSGVHSLWRPYACFRCDLRAVLLRQRLQRLPLQIRHRALSSTRALHAERSLFGEKHGDINGDDILNHGEPSLDLNGRHSPHKTILSNRNALHLPETSKINIPTLALGEPAHIIRIANSEYRPEFIHQKTPIETRQPISENGQEEETEKDLEASFSPDALIEKLDDEARTPDIVTMVEIERVRKAFEQTFILAGSPTMAQVRDVIMQLHSGFDEDQLTEYLRQALKYRSRTWANLHERYAGPLGIRSPWHAGVSEFPQGAEAKVDILAKPDSTAIFGELLQNTVGKVQQTKGKVRAVGRVLTEVWNIRPIHLQREKGEVIFRLPKGYLNLLVAHKPSPLVTLERKYDIKMDFAESKRLLRFTSSRSIAMDAVAELGNILRGIKKKELNLLDLEPWASKQSNLFMARLALSEPTYLQQVREMTNTHIEISRNRKVGEHGVLALNVYHLGQGDAEFEDVRRIILNVIDTSMIKDGMIDINVALEKFDITQVPMDASGLPLNERMLRWVRYRSTKPNRLSRNSETGAKFNLQAGLLVKTARQLLQAFLPFKKSRSSEDPSPHWDRNPVFELKASIGQVAFPAVKKLKLPKDLDARRPGSFTDQRSFYHYKSRMKDFMRSAVNVRRSLITSLPGTQQILEKIIRKVPERRAELVVLLKPAVVKDSVHIDPSHVPNLELRIMPGQIDPSTGDTVPAKLISARLMAKQKTADVLLPINSTDIRYSAQQNYSATDDFDPALKIYVLDGQLNKDAGGRFHLPSSLTLDIPTDAVDIGTTKSILATTSSLAPAVVDDPFTEAEMSGEDLENTESSTDGEAQRAIPATENNIMAEEIVNEITPESQLKESPSQGLIAQTDQESRSPPNAAVIAPIRKPGLIKESSTVRIEYMLISIEHHSTFSANYSAASSKVHYSTVTAGKAGGRRTELSLTSTGRAIEGNEITRLIQLEKALSIQTDNALQRRQAYRKAQREAGIVQEPDVESQSSEEPKDAGTKLQEQTESELKDDDTSTATLESQEPPNVAPQSEPPQDMNPDPIPESDPIESDSTAQRKARQRAASDRNLDPLERMRREHVRLARQEFEYIKTLRTHCRTLAWLQPWMESALELAGRFEASVIEDAKPVLVAPSMSPSASPSTSVKTEGQEREPGTARFTAANPPNADAEGVEERQGQQDYHPFSGKELTPRPIPRNKGDVKWRNRNREEERVRYSRYGDNDAEREAKPVKKRGGHAVFYFDKRGVR